MPLRYVYALVSGAPPPSPGLRFVKAGGLFAAVAAVAKPPPVGESALRAHDAVVRGLCQSSPAVLPVRFGTVFSDDDSLKAAIAAQRDRLAAALDLVSGREQMTVRVLGRAAPPGPAPKAPKGAGPGTKHMLARARAYAQAKVPEADRLRARLGALIEAERTERLPPPLEGRGPIAAVYHLIARGQAPAYRATIGKNKDFTVSGPFPAYAFAPEGLE